MKTFSIQNEHKDEYKILYMNLNVNKISLSFSKNFITLVKRK